MGIQPEGYRIDNVALSDFRKFNVNNRFVETSDFAFGNENWHLLDPNPAIKSEATTRDCWPKKFRQFLDEASLRVLDGDSSNKAL